MFEYVDGKHFSSVRREDEHRLLNINDRYVCRVVLHSLDLLCHEE